MHECQNCLADMGRQLLPMADNMTKRHGVENRFRRDFGENPKRFFVSSGVRRRQLMTEWALRVMPI